MTSFAVDTIYVLKYEIGEDYLYIKVWEKDKGESDGWDYMIENSSSVGGERNLRIDVKTETGSITGQGAINNKTVTLTGTGSLANTIYVAHPAKAQLETNQYASAPATLIIKDASIKNSSTATDTGFYVYHTNGHTSGDETYYLGTLQIVDSTVDVNAIWNAGTVEVSGQDTELVVRKSFQIGAGAEKTAYLHNLVKAMTIYGEKARIYFS